MADEPYIHYRPKLGSGPPVRKDLDCPTCKRGTLVDMQGFWQCLDCGRRFSKTLLAKLQKALSR